MSRSDELRRQLIAGAIVTALALAVVFGGRVYRWLADVGQGFAEEPIDRVHVELLPEWVLSVSRGGPAENEAFDELRVALDDGGVDPLLSLAEGLRSASRRGRASDAILDFVRDWNEVLDDRGIPFVVRGGALNTARGTQTFVTTARTLEDFHVAVGGTKARLRVVERVDSTNIRESVLGETVEGVDGALVLSDRMLEFAVDAVWPVLAKEGPKSPLMTAFAADVSDEVRRGISAEAFSLLEKTAEARLRAVDATRSIQARAECSGFRFTRLAWAGPRAKDLATLKRSVSQTAECPAVYEVEYTVIRDFERMARSTEGLDRALEELIAWAMRSIAMHEARHVVDAEQTGGLLEPVPCSACAGLSVREVNELSAYTAEFAWTDTPATATYQACKAVGSRGGSHRGAIVHLFEEIDADCVLGLPEQDAVRAFAKRAFDRDAPIALPDGFPSHVPLPPRARGSNGSPRND